MIATHKEDRVGRVLIWGIWGFGWIVFLMVIAFGRPFWAGLGMGLFLLSLYAMLAHLLMVMFPLVTLSEEGIVVRRMFRKRFYSWKDIIQAGIVWRTGQGTFYNQMVLIPKGGSLRHYRDKTFIVRNLFKAIFSKVSQESRDYVRRCYGLLDFDLSDGTEEQSIVVE